MRLGFHKLTTLLFFTAAAVALQGCNGGDSSPTSPTPATSTTTRIIAIEGSLAFGDVTIGQSKDLVVTLRNSGTGVMTLSGITGSSGLASLITASPSNASIPPGGSVAVTFRFTPSSGATTSGTVSFTTDHTSGTNTLSMSGTGVGAPVTVFGVVTNGSTRAPIVGATVTAYRNNISGQKLAETKTDGNGYYSIVVPSLTVVDIWFSNSGYDSVSGGVTLTADTRRDQTLNASSPALEYRVRGSRASLTYENCSGGTSQNSSANLPWSFTCPTFGSGQFVYISAQNTGDSGTITVQIYKRGVLYKESSSSGAFAIATASGTY